VTECCPSADWRSNRQDFREEESVESPEPGIRSERSALVGEIARSLRQISEILESTANDHSMSGGAVEQSDSWLNDEYLYLDVANPASEELKMDLCVHKGRAYFRVEREGLGVELVDVLT
jgi:hypothetical protein